MHNRQAFNDYLKIAGLTLLIVIFLAEFRLPMANLVPSLFLLTMVVITNPRAFPTNNYVLLILSLLVIQVAHAWLLVVIKLDSDVFELLRLLRATISFLLLGILFHRGVLEWSLVRKAILIVIGCHAILVLIQTASMDVKVFSSMIFSFDKELFRFRSFGISSSYDAAGAYIALGMLMLAARRRALIGYTRITFLIVLWLAGLFTGRTFMVIGTGILLLIMVPWCFRKGQRWGDRAVSFCFLLSIVLVAFYVVENFGFILIDSVRFFFNPSYEVGYDMAATGYYIGSGNALLSLEAFAFSTNLEFLFGTGKSLGEVDIGYVKTLYSLGVIGLIETLIVNVVLLYVIFVKSQSISPFFVRVAIASLFFIYNIKLQVFMSSGFQEIVFLLFFALLGNVIYREGFAVPKPFLSPLLANR